MSAERIAEVLAAALAYVERGWAVLPLHRILEDGTCSCRRGDCASPGKHPVAQLVPNGLRQATRNPQVVRDWFGRIAWNVGIATGAESGMVVLDVDPRHDGLESVRSLLAEHGDFRGTLTQRTGSGGYHFAFRHPGYPVRNSAGAVGPGLDVRGDGGYIVAPPSNHQSGEFYSWINEAAPLLPAPHWLGGSADTGRAVQASVAAEVAEVIPHGTQHHTLVSIAGTLRRRGLLENEIYACLAEVNRRCERPGPDANVRRIAQSMMQYAPAEAVDVAARMGEAAHGEPEEGFELIGDVVRREFGRLCDLIESGGGLPGLPTGLTALDRALGGLQRGELLAIAARPSMGKSALAFQIAEHVARQGRPVGIFSLEMSKAAVARRMMSAGGGVDSMRIRLGELTEADIPRLAAGAGAIYELPLYVADRTGITVERMRRLCLGLDAPPAALFVDYLQLVQGEAASGRAFQREDEEIGAVSRDLKGLAKEFDVPVVALVQLNRKVEDRSVKKPQLADLRGSGQIEQDLDVALMLWRPERYGAARIERDGGFSIDAKGVAEISIAKQRDGALSDFFLRFNEALVRFEDYHDDLTARLPAPRVNGHAYAHDDAPF